MAAKKTKALAGLLAPKEVGLNRDTNLLKLVAMISMLIDHTGKMFFSQYRIMRIIGRLAFPLYAYCIAVGGVYSKNKLKYLSRILLMGLISQPFYAVALAHTVPAMYAERFADNPLGAVMNFYVQSWAVPNIMLTLALGLMLIWSLREGQYVCALSVALLVWKAQNAVNYGWRGVALIALFYLTISHWWVSLPVMSAYMLWWGSQGASYHMFGAGFGIQMFAILALPL
ncbi:MAG: hypothetical protein IJH03_04505, partial [Clostridia bacterium]|nr:hypothetical protein [Clostridia bacterium]